MTIYDLNLPAETVLKLEAIINAIHTEKAAELKEKEDAFFASSEKSAAIFKESFDKLTAELTTTKAEFAAYQSAAQQAITAAQAAIKNDALDDAATVAAIADVVTGLTASDEEKRKAEILAKIEALKKELAE
jgi:hypothetical protein